MPVGIADYIKTYDLELWSFAALEAQVAAIADDIAYDAHDIDDGLRAGLFHLDDLEGDAADGGDHAEIARALSRSRRGRRGARAGARTDFAPDRCGVVGGAEGARRRETQSAQDVRRQSRALVTFPPAVAEAEAAIKTFSISACTATRG